MAIDDPMLSEDDGLLLPEVGPWATTKHRKIGYHSSLFAASMKKKGDSILASFSRWTPRERMVAQQLAPAGALMGAAELIR